MTIAYAMTESIAGIMIFLFNTVSPSCLYHIIGEPTDLFEDLKYHLLSLWLNGL
jgi:hypothetical protein